MKSIKEKTNEVFDDPFQQECFEAGANYVLEQVENIVLNKNKGLVEMWDELMTLIEQLKK